MILLVASPLAIVPLVGFAAETFSAQTIFLFVASFASIGHHLPGFLRAYGDRSLFDRFRWRFLLAPPLVAAAATLFTVNRMHGLDLILVLWATWHIMMQTYGLMRIYDLKRGVRDRTTARLNLAVCLAVFAVGIVFSQTRIFSILEIAEQVGLALPPPATLAGLRWLIGASCGLLTFGYAVNGIVQARRHGPSWPKLLLLAMTGWLYWSCGSLSTNLLIGVTMFEIFHALQYDTLVWTYNRRLTSRAGEGTGPLRLLFANGWLSMACYVAAIAAFGSVKWVAESIDASAVKTALLILLLTSTALHFYFDGFIWKVSETSTQENIGIEGSGRARSRVPALVHAAKWGLLAAVGVLLVWIEVERPPPTASEEEARIAEILARTPDVPELLVKSGQIRLAHGDANSAAESARRAVQLRPSSADGYLLLAESLATSHDFSAARDAAQQASALDPTSASASYQVGLSSAQLHDFPTAERALKQSIALNPDFVRSHIQLGNVYRLTRRAPLAEQSHQRAVSLARRAAEKRPSSADAYSLLAEALAESRDYSAARDAAERATTLDPTSATASYQVGLASVQLRDFPTAERALQESIGLNPNFAESHFQLGNVYFLTNRAPLAERSYRRAITLAPRLAGVQTNLGAVLLQLGRVAEAKAVLLAALESESNAQSHYNLGMIELNEGESSEARRHFQRAETLGQPISPEIRRAAGL